MRAILFFGLLAILSYFSLYLFAEFELFRQIPAVRNTLILFSSIMTATFAVVLLGKLTLGWIGEAIFHHQPSGLLRGATFAVLTFVASTVLLNMYGVNIGAMLTTSAILGATVGLAMQPTLGSLFSGLALSSDRSIAIGDAFWWEGRPVTVTAINWRHTVMRRGDNIYVKVPNSRLASETLLYLPEDQPVAFRVHISISNSVPPQKVTDLLAGAFSDFEHLDSAYPLSVIPLEDQPEYGAIKYLLYAHGRDYRDIFELQGEVMRRAWYVLERAGISMARNRLYRDAPNMLPDIAALIARAFPALSAKDRTALAKGGHWVRFAPTERLTFGAEHQGRAIAILEGQAKSGDDVYLNLLEHGRAARTYLPTIVTHRIHDDALLRGVADRLADEIGPYAEHALRVEVHKSKDYNELITRLAEHISDSQGKETFIKACLVEQQDIFGPGTVSGLRNNVTGVLIPEPELRAESEVLALTFPLALLDRVQKATRQAG